MATLPPGFNKDGICSSISFNAPNSSFTSILNAWKTWAKYLLGFPLTISRTAFLKPSIVLSELAQRLLHSIILSSDHLILTYTR